MERIGGGVTTLLEGSHDSVATQNHSVQVEGYSATTVGREDEPSALTVSVYGDELHDATKSITLSSGTSLRLVCVDAQDASKKSVISMTPESIRIESDEVVVKGRQRVLVLGDGPAVELTRETHVLSDTIKLYSKSALLELDDTVHMTSPQIDLNAADETKPDISDPEAATATKRFRWRMLDAALQPYAKKKYALITQGYRTMGSTDAQGLVEKQVPDDAAVLHLTLWIDEYPQGPRLKYTIRLRDLPAATTLLGAQIRLRNLGYYLGADTDEETPELVAAVHEFQVDNGLPPTGNIADAGGKLAEVHEGGS